LCPPLLAACLGFRTAGHQCLFLQPLRVAIGLDGATYVGDTANHRIRKVLPTGVVTTLAGNGTAGFADGAGSAAMFYFPHLPAVDSGLTVFVPDASNALIRLLAATTLTSLVTKALFINGAGLLFSGDLSRNAVVTISQLGVVSDLAGGSGGGHSNGFGSAAQFNAPLGLAVSETGTAFVANLGNNCVRQLTCMPCPASFHCSSGGPALCPAGSFCPLSSVNATLCPKGSYSNPGAASLHTLPRWQIRPICWLHTVLTVPRGPLLPLYQRFTGSSELREGQLLSRRLCCPNVLPLASASLRRVGRAASARPCIPRGDSPVPQPLLLELNVRRRRAQQVLGPRGSKGQGV
jgi:hypothetical protein